MDLISQIQDNELKLYKDLIEIVNNLSGNIRDQKSDIPEHGAKLSVANAHAFSQLSQMGFPGLINVTTPLAPPLYNESMTEYLQNVYTSINYGKQFYMQIRTVDYLMSKLPDHFESLDEYEALLANATKEYEDSQKELYEAEIEAKKTRDELDQILDFAVNELTPFVKNVDEQSPLDTFDLYPPQPHEKENIIEVSEETSGNSGPIPATITE